MTKRIFDNGPQTPRRLFHGRNKLRAMLLNARDGFRDISHLESQPYAVRGLLSSDLLINLENNRAFVRGIVSRTLAVRVLRKGKSKRGIEPGRNLNV